MKKILFIFTAFVLFFTQNTSAQTRKIYINGMDLSKYLITNVELKNVTIKFDSKGNIYISAPGYNLKPGEASKDVPKDADEKLATRFYLVTFPKPVKSVSGFDVDLLINGKFVKRIYSDSGQLVYDVSEYMKKGKNIISFVSKKGKEIKDKTAGQMKLAIARGYESKGTYIIKDIIWQIKRTSKDPKSSYVDKKQYTVK
ncbi:MAG: hypothetical protein JXR95_15545 [Deltaproteobacteria bacterium]|nr:hypothetical protein [Deltaproteobacteria bacterium]